MKKIITLIVSGILLIILAVVIINGRLIFERTLTKVLKQYKIIPAQIESDIFNKVVLKDVTYGKIANIKKVSIYYTPFYILRKNISLIAINDLILTPGNEINKITFPFGVDKIKIFNGKAITKPSNDTINYANITCKLKKTETGFEITISSGELLFSSKGMPIKLKNLKGDISLVDTVVTINKLSVNSGNTEIEIKGEISPNSKEFNFNTKDLSLKNIIEDVSGKITLTASLKIKGIDTTLTAETKIKNLNYKKNYIGDIITDANYSNTKLQLQIKKWTLGKMFCSGTAVANLNGQLSSYNATLIGQNIDLSVFNKNIRSDLIGKVEVIGEGEKAQIVLNSSGSIMGFKLESLVCLMEIKQSGKPSNMPHIEIKKFEAKEKETEIKIAGTINQDKCNLLISGKKVGLSNFDSKINGETSFDFIVNGNPKDPVVLGSFYIKGFEFDKIKSEYISGNIRFNSLFKPEGEAEIDIANMNLYNNELNSFKAIVKADSGRTHFDVLAEGEEAGLKFKGNGNGLSFTGTEFLFYSPKVKITNKGDMNFKLAINKVEIENWNILINNSLFYLNGMFSKTLLDIALQSSKIDLHNLADSLAGTCELKSTIKGIPTNPQVDLNVYINKFSYKTMIADEIVFKGMYKNEMFYIETGKLTRGSRSILLDGELPMAKSFKTSDKQIKINLNVVNIENEFSYMYRDFCELENCKINGKLVISGSYKVPTIYGNIGINGEALKIRSTDTRLTQPDIKIKFDGDKIVINSFTAKTVGGDVSLSGTVKMPEEVNIGVRINNLELKNIEDMSAKISASLAINGSFKNPKVSGIIRVKEAEINTEFRTTKSVNVQSPMDYDLEIDFPDKVWIKNTMLDAELSGNVRPRKIGNEFFIAGDASVKNGYFYYFDRPFKIDTGEIRFTNSELNPIINISASTTVNYTSEKNNTTGADTTKNIVQDTISIIVNVSGTLREPKMIPSSKPPMLPEDIMSLLSLNMKASDISKLESARYQQAIGNKVTSYYLFRRTGILNELRQQVGVDVLNLEPELFGEKKARFNVGKYVLKDLYINYTNDLFALSKQEFKVEYTPWKYGAIVAERKEEVNRVGMKLILRY
ncbi:MAG: translocation/assembly module TamB domain-containing protein [bacterium]|nr:translocation/assembly module TamB domain-containing protein [bacterium]